MIDAIERLKNGGFGNSHELEICQNIPVQNLTPLQECLRQFDKSWQGSNSESAVVKVYAGCPTWNFIPDIKTELPEGLITNGEAFGIMTDGTVLIKEGNYIFYSHADTDGKVDYYLRTKLSENALRKIKGKANLNSVVFKTVVSIRGGKEKK